jgi:hypothetical protein
METGKPFVAYVMSFDFGSDAILLLAAQETVGWLMSQFGRLSRTPVGSSSHPIIIGDGDPVMSNGRCILSIELNDEPGSSSQLVRGSESVFAWSVSRSSANRYQHLLSGMLVPIPCHQYLEPDNCPPAPVFIVSRGEYQLDAFIHPKI